MVFLPRRQQVAVKVEGTEGTDAVVAAADVVGPSFNIEYNPEVTMSERRVQQASKSQQAQIAGERLATISFETELKGSGTAGTVPPNLSAALQGCDMDETIVASTSVTYGLVSDSAPSVTVEIREGTHDSTTFKIKKIIGARGTYEITGVKGDIMLIKFTFTGVYVEPTEGVALTSPAITPKPEPFLGMAFSFQGVGALLLQNWSLDIGNVVALRNDVNQASGNFSAVITDRIPIGALDPEEVLIATLNFPNQLTTNAEGVLSWVLGATAGNILTFNAPKTQIIGNAPADRDAIRTAALEIQYNENTAAGDDEFTLAFT